nr:hypothetical protein [Alsobacter metallidurans]
MIVWFHSNIPGHDLAYSGLIVFLSLTAFFEFGPNRNRPAQPGRILTQLIVPWLFWFVIFAAINLARGREIFPFGDNAVEKLLTGPSPHLWYVPWAAAALLALPMVKPLPDDWLAYGLAAAAGVMMTAVPTWRPWSIEAGPPLSQYLHSIPALLLGGLLGLSFSSPVARFLYVVPVVALVAGPAFRFTGVGITYVIGLSMVLLALMIERFWPPRLNLDSVSQCMLGVYFCHPLFLTAARPLIDRAPLPGVVAAFVLSVAFVYAIRRIVPGLATLTT